MALCAQQVTVSAKTERIRGESANGWAAEINGPAEAVATAWNRYVKELGKTKAAGDYVAVSAPAPGGTAYDKGTVYTKAGPGSTPVTVWAGMLDKEWTENELAMVSKELEQWVHRFCVKFYRDQIQTQIDEAQRALDAEERARQRLANQNKDLTGKLTSNEAEKVRLEKQLENNRVEHASLLSRLEKNKKAQDSVAAAVAPIKAMLEAHQERQRKVN
jgi:hypothetical protein